MQQQESQRDNTQSPSRQRSRQQIAELTSKLNSQAERILKWKMQTEMELKKRDEKLKEVESTIQKQHTNMLNQQMQCEKLSHRLQAELLNRGELKVKVENTRQICTVLQQHCTYLSDTLKRSMDEKIVLKNVYDEQLKCIDELTQKYSVLHDNYIEMEKVKSLLAEERQAHVKDLSDARAMKVVLEQRLETATNLLKTEKKKVDHLEKRLIISEKSLQEIGQERETLKQEFEKVKQQLTELEITLTQEKQNFTEESKQFQLLLSQEKQNVELLKLQGEQLVVQLTSVVHEREEILNDNKIKEETIAQLSSQLADKDEEIHNYEKQLKELGREKQDLELQVLEMEQLRAKLSLLQISMNNIVNEKEEETRQLADIREEVQKIQTAMKLNEDLLAKCDEKREHACQQVAHLEYVKSTLESKLAESQTIINSMSFDVKQLEKDGEEKSKEMENLLAALTNLTTSSESKLMEKQEEADALNLTKAKLENENDILNKTIEDYKNRFSGLQLEVEQLQKVLAEEGDRTAALTDQLKNQEPVLTKAQSSLAEKQVEINKLMEQLDLANKDKLQMEARTDTLLGELAKLAAEKNTALSEAACNLQDKQMLEAQIDAKLQEAATLFEKCKQECEELSHEHKQSCDRFQNEIECLKNEKSDLEEKLSMSEKQLNDTIMKLKDVADKNQFKKRRMQERTNQLEKKLQVKEQEVKQLRTYKAKPSSPSTFSAEQTPIPHQKPNFGMPTTPKALSAEPARGILKTPTTPISRKRVVFQEESSDTDASAVEIMEKEVQRRMDAIKRGERVNSIPLHVVKSPSKIMKRGDLNNPNKDTPTKKSRFVGESETTVLTPSKPKNKIVFKNDYDNAFGFNDD